MTASGFKPETFSSVVRCSIQLSYAAIPFLRSAKIQKTAVFTNTFYKIMKYVDFMCNSFILTGNCDDFLLFLKA